MSEEEGVTLEYTPTWVVAGVCTVIVAISLAAERVLHYTGVTLKRKHQKPLFEALQKVKEELMLLGFISLLLTVFQNVINKICVPADVTRHMLPCKLEKGHKFEESNTCSENKVPLLSTEALHHLHIFIFVLAIVHVTFCVLTVVFGGLRIRQWKRWEDEIAKNNYDSRNVPKSKTVTDVHQHAFIKEHFQGLGKNSVLLGWLYSFVKQFYGSVTKSDYTTLRLGFIMTHCRSNPKFNFHKYMIRALEDDFKKVVGIRQVTYENTMCWYLWIFVVIFLLLNVNEWSYLDGYPPLLDVVHLWGKE
uniref:MLO-like protein n=1 Tax=Quercus lobata TaxID=97700 RepID=A0A7N2MCS7_QUELO